MIYQPDEPLVLAVDPGKVSGVTAWTPEHPITITAGEYDMMHTVKVIESAVRMVEEVEIVCEDFVISERTIKVAHDRTPLILIGWLEIMCRQKGVEFTLQTAAQAKRFATDDKLRAVGWFQKTDDGHANDAARHMLVYLRKSFPLAFSEHIIPCIAKEILS